MSSRFTISIPERDWQPIADAPLDGTILFVRDQFDHVDIIKWDRGEWTAEIGVCSDPQWFCRMWVGAVTKVKE